jgi:hypothetical protein
LLVFHVLNTIVIMLNTKVILSIRQQLQNIPFGVYQILPSKPAQQSAKETQVNGQRETDNINPMITLPRLPLGNGTC